MKSEGQSRRRSLEEALVSTIIGYGVALVGQLIVFPWKGIHVTLAANIEIGVIFTVISMVRAYTVRRFFNWLR
jgi:hypothetical protein